MWNRSAEAGKDPNTSTQVRDLSLLPLEEKKSSYTQIAGLKRERETRSLEKGE